MEAPAPGSVVQLRKGEEVQLARIAELRGSQLVGTDELGKPLKLPLDRALQVVGPLAALADADPERVRAALAALRAAALAAAARIDLELLWEAVRARAADEPIDRLLELYLGHGGTAEERLGLGFALCADRQFFKQKGSTFRPRMEAEVEARKAQHAADEARAARRRAFVEWAARGIAAAPPVARAEGLGAEGGAAERSPAPAPPPPEGCEPFLALVEDLAVRGDESAHGKEARALLVEVKEEARKRAARGAPPPPGADGEGAFWLLERLGVFSPHENLALRRLAIPTAFPPDVLAESEALAPFVFDPAAEPRRQDLRALAATSIDNADTRDRDDAVSIRAESDGGWTVWLHHADPTPFVRPGSRLDDEAARRGTSVYLPTARYPMLPPRLSEELMSLVAGADRPALTVEVRFDEARRLRGHDIYASAIHVTENLSYAEADRRLDEGEPALSALRALAGALLGERLARGALDLAIEERELTVDPRTFAVEVRRADVRSAAHQLVAELAILANRLLGERLAAAGAAAIYRRQDPPAEPIAPPAAGASRRVWAFEARRRLGRMDLGLDPAPHATLGLPLYLQATSPIRRYQDLLHHRQLAAVLAGERPPYDREALARLAQAVELSVQEAAACERETVFYWLLVYIARWRRDHPREPLAGEALGRTRDRRLVVHIDALVHHVPVPVKEDIPPGAPVWIDVLRVEPRRGELKLAVRRQTAAG